MNSDSLLHRPMQYLGNYIPRKTMLQLLCDRFFEMKKLSLRFCMKHQNYLSYAFSVFQLLFHRTIHENINSSAKVLDEQNSTILYINLLCNNFLLFQQDMIVQSGLKKRCYNPQIILTILKKGCF